MCTEDIIQSEIDKFLEKKEISVPKKKNDFIDYRSEDSTQGVPPHLCVRFSTPEIDAINKNYPAKDKKVIGKFRFRYFCLFELYTFDTHDEQSHEGYTIDLTFPIPDEDDVLTPIRTEAFNRIKKVFVDRPWARPYSGANWHHLRVFEISEKSMKEDPRGFEVALREFLDKGIQTAIDLSKKLN